MDATSISNFLGIDITEVHATITSQSIDKAILIELHKENVTPERARKLYELAWSDELKEQCKIIINTSINAELNRENVTPERARELYELAQSTEVKVKIISYLYIS